MLRTPARLNGTLGVMELSLNDEPIPLGIGFGKLKFGDSKNRVVELLGVPDRKETIEYVEGGNDFGEAWDYDNLEVTLWFDQSDDDRLGTIETESQNLLANGDKIIGQRQTKVEALLALGHGQGKKPPETLAGIDILEFTDIGLTCYFKNSRAYKVQWSYLWKDENTPDWPT